MSGASESYFLTIFGKIEEKAENRGIEPDDYQRILPWATEHEPEAAAEETRLFAEMDAATDEQENRKAVLAYGKALLQIINKYAAWKERAAAAAPVRKPEPPKRYEPQQGRLI